MDEQKVIKQMEDSGKILFSERDLEKFGFKSANSLRNDRYKGVGLPFVRVGKRNIKYLRSDLVKWLSQNRVVPDGE